MYIYTHVLVVRVPKGSFVSAPGGARRQAPRQRSAPGGERSLGMLVDGGMVLTDGMNSLISQASQGFYIY